METLHLREKQRFIVVAIVRTIIAKRQQWKDSNQTTMIVKVIMENVLMERIPYNNF